MSGCYDKGLRCLAMEIAKQLDVASLTQEGVYAMVGGPNFETIAEARLLHRLGVDAVGKSSRIQANCKVLLPRGCDGHYSHNVKNIRMI